MTLKDLKVKPLLSFSTWTLRCFQLGGTFVAIFALLVLVLYRGFDHYSAARPLQLTALQFRN